MRLFIAVNFTDEFKSAITEYQSRLRELKDDSHINWTREENLHLTLAFIGEYDDVGAVRNALDTVDFKPFTIKTNGCGNFGTLRWVGITENAVRLSDKVRAALDESGIPYDEKPMKPHVTVAREMIIDRRAALPKVRESSMTVGRISLMKSERIKGKLTYTEIYYKEAKSEEIYE
ncbi:MAG: RNA 2',3'-cyclic phosphodiesterase [Eubacteriales bacterium]